MVSRREEVSAVSAQVGEEALGHHGVQGKKGREGAERREGGREGSST